MLSSFLILSYILFGYYALIVQVVCIREILVVFQGNELCLGVIFACWLIGVAVGAGTAARIINRIRQKLPLYLLLFILFCVLFPVQIYGIRILRSLLHVASGEFIPPVKLILGALGMITPFSFLDGAIFPVACSLLPTSGTQQIGRMYIAEAIGNIIGGITFTFFLVTRYNALQIAALSGCIVFLILGLLSLSAYRGKLKFALRGVIGIIALMLSVLYGYAFLSPLANNLHDLIIKKRWQSMHQYIDFVESVDSKYENLALGVQTEQYALFTNGQYVTAFPDEYESAMTAHFYMTEHPDPRHVLLIGGGAEGLISEILKHSVETLDYVELDPKLLALISKYLPPDAIDALNDPRVSVIYADGRYYVKQTNRRYDVVILNIPEPTNAMLNRFYTLEFFREVQRILNPGGVVITEVSSSLHLQENAANYTGSIYKTFHQVFPYVLVTPGTSNVYFATSEPDIITFDLGILTNRYLERGITSDYFSEYYYETLLLPEQIAFVESTLQQGLNTFRLNIDFQPVTYFYSLLLWMQFSEITPERLSASITAKILHKLHRISVWWFFVPIICFVIIRIGYLQSRRMRDTTRFNCLWAIGTTGFAGMALELILIFVFQNIYGYIYQKAGLIIAVFMVGLAAGGYISHTKLKHHPSSHKLTSRLLSIEIAIVIFAALLPFCIRFLSALNFPILIEYVFMLFVGVAGILTGAEFPLASAMYVRTALNSPQSRKKKGAGKAAGMLDSADHLGACCGSLLVGVLFVPLLGMTVSCYFVSILNLSSVVFLLLQLKD